jgi:hypothetical protein
VHKAAAAFFALVTVAVASATLPGSVLAASGAPAAEPRATHKKVLVVGDSVALTLGIGIQRWGKQHGIKVQNSAVLGCTLMDDNLVINQSGTVRRKRDFCHTHKDWPALLRKFRPNLVIALFGGLDVYNMSWDNGHSWSWAGKPAFNKRYLATMRDASTRLASSGGHVLWLSPPCFGYIKGDTGSTPASPWYDRRRVAALGTMLHTVATKTHQLVNDVVHTANCPVNYKTRPDGVHFSRAGADAMMSKLGPVILRALGS